jgi:hypothetical protein
MKYEVTTRSFYDPLLMEHVQVGHGVVRFTNKMGSDICLLNLFVSRTWKSEYVYQSRNYEKRFSWGNSVVFGRLDSL